LFQQNGHYVTLFQRGTVRHAENRHMTLRKLRLSSISSRQATCLGAALAVACLASAPAHALRLAHSRIVSAPNAPLEVLVGIADLTPDEQRSLMASLADPSAWQRAGVTPPVPLSSITLRLEGGSNPTRRNLRITSTQPAGGPAVDLLLDLGTSEGQRQVQLSVMQTSRGFPGLTSQAVAGGAARSRGTGAVAVRSGDTLYGIAQSRAVEDATIYQMLVAMWRANPQAFIQNNMNLVKAGVTLTVPDAATVRAIDPAEARRIFMEQAEAYARYRASLAGAAARGTAAAAAPSSGGQVGTAPPGLPPAPQTQDRVRLSSGEPGTGDAQAQAQAKGDADTSIAKATEDAQTRVGELERNVKDLNEALARTQGTGGAPAQTGNGASDASGLAVPSLGGGGAAAPGRVAGASGGAAAGAAAGTTPGGQGSSAPQGTPQGTAPAPLARPDAAGANSRTAAPGVGTNGSGATGGSGATPGAPATPGITGDASTLGASPGLAGLPGSPGTAGGSAGVSPSAAPGTGISPTLPGPAGSTPQTDPGARSTPGGDSGGDVSAGAVPTQDAQSPTSGLPAWLSDNLLIVLTAVLALIAFVIAWLLRRAAARREEDQDELDEELYMSEIDEGTIDRRLEGINLDLDEPPTDEDRRRPGVVRT
jgi:pilus assembly protein FimV